MCPLFLHPDDLEPLHEVSKPSLGPSERVHKCTRRLDSVSAPCRLQRTRPCIRGADAALAYCKSKVWTHLSDVSDSLQAPSRVKPANGGRQHTAHGPSAPLVWLRILHALLKIVRVFRPKFLARLPVLFTLAGGLAALLCPIRAACTAREALKASHARWRRRWRAPSIGRLARGASTRRWGFSCTTCTPPLGQCPICGRSRASSAAVCPASQRPPNGDVLHHGILPLSKGFGRLLHGHLAPNNRPCSSK